MPKPVAIVPGITVGSVVYLKSGGPFMTVSHLKGVDATCMWFVVGHAITQTFVVAALNLISQEQLVGIRGDRFEDNDSA